MFSKVVCEKVKETVLEATLCFHQSLKQHELSGKFMGGKHKNFKKIHQYFLEYA